MVDAEQRRALGALPSPLWAGQSHVASFRRTGATSESKSGRARNFGIQPRSRTHDSNPKFPHAIALPQGGGERTECAALFCINHLDFAHANCAAPIGVSFGSIRRGR